MPRLPSAQDVRRVPPAVMRDPGVRVPQGAFSSALGDFADAFAPVLMDISGKLRDAEVRQNNRRNTVHAAIETNAVREDLTKALLDLNATEDLADERTLTKYGELIEGRIQKSLQSHREQGADDESLARLMLQLQGIKSDAIGRAAAMSVRLGRERVKSVFDAALTPLASKAAADPTPDTINTALTDLESQIGLLRDAIGPDEEHAFRQTGRERIALGAIDALIGRGRAEQAAALIDEAGLATALTPDTQRQIRQRIESLRFARDEGLRTIAAAEAALGRPLKEEEKLAALGLAPKTPLVNINQAGETARAKAEGEAMAKITVEQLPALRRQRGNLQAMQTLLDRGTETGGFRQLQLTAANFFGTTPESLSDLAAFRSVSNAATLAKTAELKGAISEKELSFVQAAVASAGTGTEANKAILRIQSKLLDREIESLRMMANYHASQGTLNGFEEFLQTWANANPLFTEAEQKQISSDLDVTSAPNIPVIKDQAAYDALPKGSRYTTGDGKTRIKR